MKDPEITTINELKIFIDGKLSKIHKDLEKINKILQGNGKESMEVRLDRLENSQKSAKESKKNWASWIIPLLTVLIGSFLGAFFASLF